MLYLLTCKKREMGAGNMFRQPINEKFFNYNYRPIKNELQVIFIAEVVKISDVFKKIRLQGFCRHIFSFHVLLPNCIFT